MENSTETVERGGEVAQVATPKVELNLNSEQYLELKALFNAASDESNRLSLQYVYFDVNRNRFLCSNGHIGRIHTLTWTDADGLNPMPQFNFTLRREDFMLTKAQLKHKPFQSVPTYSLEESDQSLLQTMGKVMEPSEAFYGHHVMGFTPEVLNQFCKSFIKPPAAFVFRFSRLPIQPVFVYGNSEHYLGVIMPARILNNEGLEPSLEWKMVEVEQEFQSKQAA